MKALKLILNQKYQKGLSSEELYELARTNWIVPEDLQNQAEYAMSVAHGTVLELYKIKKWMPVKSTSKRQRWQFEGEIAEEWLRNQCIGKEHKNRLGDQSPVVLVDLDDFINNGKNDNLPRKKIERMETIKLNISQKFRKDMSSDELFEATQHEAAQHYQSIKQENMKTIEYALVVAKDKDDKSKNPRARVRALYKINGQESVKFGKWSFSGEPVDDKLLGQCINKRDKRDGKNSQTAFSIIDLRVFKEFGYGIEKLHVERALDYIATKGKDNGNGIYFVFGKPEAIYILHKEKKCGIKEAIRIAYCYSINEEPKGEHGTFTKQQYDLFNHNSEGWNTYKGCDFLTSPEMKFDVLGIKEYSDSRNKERSREHQQLLELLKQFGQIILCGPPGTGKTYSAKQILMELLNVKNEKALGGLRAYWDIVQFHPSYNYEDFVRGVQVKTEEKKVVYETVNRVFGTMCDNAYNNPNKPYVLIIDEINRANVSAVLGELIYALEYRGKPVKTPYLDDIIIPENLYVIGTMNTADRTIGQIDYAVRRRFAFVPCLPERNIIEQQFPDALDFYDATQKLFHPQNGELSPNFNTDDVSIGHSYFMAEGRALDNQIAYKVIPILWEYVKDGVLKESAIEKIEKLQSDAENLRDGIENLDVEEEDDTNIDEPGKPGRPPILTKEQQQQWKTVYFRIRRRMERRNFSKDEISEELRRQKKRLMKKWETQNTDDLSQIKRVRLHFQWEKDGRSGSAGVGRTALGVIKDFISQHPAMTAEELAETFRPVDLNTHKRIELLENISDLHRYFDNEADQVLLDDGTTVCISRQWGATGKSESQWNDFTSHMEEMHGYSIRAVEPQE